MSATDLLHRLTDPSCYPESLSHVEVLQTHISIVALAGTHAYKLKKPLRLPFLDFSTLALRRHFCGEEVRLNRRLCTDVYLGISELRSTPAGLRFGAIDPLTAPASSVGTTAPVRGVTTAPPDTAIDVAVVMRRLPQHRMLDQLLAADAVPAAAIAALARITARFHRDADRGPAVQQAGDPDRLRALALANFDELATLADSGLDQDLLLALRHCTTTDFDRILPMLRWRCANGLVVDGHGDLHARNVCMTDPPTIYDCLEFSADFRCGDVATDVAFLVMDLRYRGAAALADTFATAYADAAADPDLPSLLPALVGYRAMVRAKVAALASGENELPEHDRARARSSAADHVQLAAATSLAARGPRWLVLCGPPGTGKSSLAAALQRGTGWPCIATDVVRKQLAGIGPTDRAAAEQYAPGFSQRTYDEVLARATAASRAGSNTVLLDGNFPKPHHRAAAATAAAAIGAAITIVHVTVPAAVGRERVAARARTSTSVSDAGPREHDALWDRFVAPTAAEPTPRLDLDGTRSPAQLASQVLTALLAATDAGSGHTPRHDDSRT